MPATWGFESTLLLAFFYAFLYLTGLLVHAALVLVHEGVGLGEDGVDVGDGAFLDGAAVSYFCYLAELFISVIY